MPYRHHTLVRMHRAHLARQPGDGGDDERVVGINVAEVPHVSCWGRRRGARDAARSASSARRAAFLPARRSPDARPRARGARAPGVWGSCDALHQLYVYLLARLDGVALMLEHD